MNKRMILLVDDEPHVIRVLRLMLEREGYEVASANDGNEALEKMRRTPPRRDGQRHPDGRHGRARIVPHRARPLSGRALPDLRDDLDDGAPASANGCANWRTSISSKSRSARANWSRAWRPILRMPLPSRRTPMQPDTLNDLDYTRYARWLRRITGAEHDFAVCGAGGEVAWSALPDSDIQPWIAAQCAAGFAWPCDGEGMQRLDADGVTLLYMAIHGKTGLLGYLAVRVATELDAPTAWDALAETFEDIGAGIADECASRRELDNMALELSERYEELHLVYAIDKQVQQLEPGADLFQKLLQSWAEHMDADVAAFVKPGENLCVHATNLSAPIHNLDLVLVEMRGDLYRFTHSARAPIVINDVDDPRRAYIFTDLPFKLLCCPVIHDRSVVAILVLANHLAKPDFSNSDRKLGEAAGEPAIGPVENVRHAGRDPEIQRPDGECPDRGGRSERPVHARPLRARAPHHDADRRGAEPGHARHRRPVLGFAPARRRQDRHSRCGAVQAGPPDAPTSSPSSRCTRSAATRSCATSTV